MRDNAVTIVDGVSRGETSFKGIHNWVLTNHQGVLNKDAASATPRR